MSDVVVGAIIGIVGSAIPSIIQLLSTFGKDKKELEKVLLLKKIEVAEQWVGRYERYLMEIKHLAYALRTKVKENPEAENRVLSAMIAAGNRALTTFDEDGLLSTRVTLYFDLDMVSVDLNENLELNKLLINYNSIVEKYSATPSYDVLKEVHDSKDAICDALDNHVHNGMETLKTIKRQIRSSINNY